MKSTAISTDKTSNSRQKKLKGHLITVSILIIAMQMLAFADPSISNMVNNAVNLVFGMVAFGGIVNIVRGAATVAKGLQDDGGGQDASAISKGRGQLLAGAVMVSPTALITLITQQSPGTLISNYFR